MITGTRRRNRDTQTPLKINVKKRCDVLAIESELTIRGSSFRVCPHMECELMSTVVSRVLAD
jgi:hypothetical protein